MATASVSFAQQLRQEMDEQGISTRELARRLNPDDIETGRSHIRKLLRGKHDPSRVTRQRYARALGLPAGRFLEADAPFRPGDERPGA